MITRFNSEVLKNVKFRFKLINLVKKYTDNFSE